MKRTILYFLLLLFLTPLEIHAQVGMTVSPGKLYYKIAPGGSATQKIVVSNPNNSELEVGVSMNDWDYDTLGNNQTYNAGTLDNSSSAWIQVMPGSYFTLQPNEKRELDIMLVVPNDADTSIPVHTSMLFLTQLNPGDARASNGASIKVSVRMGVKIYHAFTQVEERNIEVVNFTDILPAENDPSGSSGFLELNLHNTGKLWLEGTIKWELLNTQNGVKTKLKDQEIFSLPGDKRIVRQELPANIAAGKYTATAIINYGNKDELRLVELEFER
jgi:P pilus assembly chaperone PapD